MEATLGLALIGALSWGILFFIYYSMRWVFKLLLGSRWNIRIW